jgi:hypothetical protein
VGRRTLIGGRIPWRMHHSSPSLLELH